MQESYVNVLLEFDKIGCSIGISARWMSECSLPIAVRIREGTVNRMEFVIKQRIGDFDLFSKVVGDGNKLLRDNLRRRDDVRCPIPVRLAKISGSFLPIVSVN